MKKISCFILFIISICSHSRAQIIYPCNISGYQENLAQSRATRQSSNYYMDGGFSSIATDGVIGNTVGMFSRTNEEYRSWWEVDLGEDCFIRGIKIFYPDDLYPTGLSKYYILLSEVPFENNTLPHLLSSTVVNYYYVENSIPTGQEIPLDGQRARYIRIQSETTQPLAFYEVQIPGGGGEQFSELCNNALDDDCDGRIDCEDPSCSPVIWWVNKKDPTCEICYDGFIEIKAYGVNLEYSIDGGASFHSCTQINQPGWCGFDGLGVGDYSIKVRSAFGGCITEWRNNLVELRAPDGTPNGCCDNGDFESGNLSNWTGGIGDHVNSPAAVEFPNNNIDLILDNPATPFDDARHRIISQASNYTDPKVPNLVISQGGTGTYIVRLGDTGSGGKAERLTYCFTVEECNSMFLFNYLIVLEDPNDGHSSDQKPFFQFVLTDNTTNEEIKRTKHVADVNDPFFNMYDVPGDEDDIAYTFWRCDLTDLSDRLGHSVCIEFITADCYPGEHFGYAYIDGLCNSIEDMRPTPVLKNFHDTYCNNQEIKIDGTESYGYNQFGWSVCELLNGTQEINCVEQPLAPYGQIGVLNVKQFYTSGGYPFQCGKTYRVKLTLGNECSDLVTVTKDIVYLCQDGVTINYPDLINCAGDQADVQINGQILNCPNCVVNWTPAQYLSDPTDANPTIEGSLNVLALSQTYHITAEDELGCIAEDDIKIYNLHSGSFSASKTVTFCEIVMTARFETNFLTAYGTINVVFINTTTQEEIQGQIVENIDFSNIWNFTTGPLSKLNFSSGIWRAQYEFTSPIQTNCVSNFIDLGQISGSGLFVGDFFICLPTHFAPAGVNNTFRPGILPPYICGVDSPILPPGYPCKDYGHNAYWGRLRVWKRWGEDPFSNTPVHDVEIIGSADIPFNMNDLAWDGNLPNGDPALSEVYVYVFELENCTNPRGNDCGDQNGFQRCSTVDVCSGYSTKRSRWVGDITLIR